MDNAKGAAKYGIAVPDGISFNLEKIIDRKDKVVKKLTGGVKQTVKSYGAELIEKEADRKSTRLNSSHSGESRMPSSA